MQCSAMGSTAAGSSASAQLDRHLDAVRVGVDVGRRVVVRHVGLRAPTDARDRCDAPTGAEPLVEAYPGRFVLAVGASHGPTLARGGVHSERPFERIREQLDTMEAAAPADTP